jgi:hypothetical protein
MPLLEFGLIMYINSVLKDPKINAQFGKATPELAKKNVVAFTKLLRSRKWPF